MSFLPILQNGTGFLRVLSSLREGSFSPHQQHAKGAGHRIEGRAECWGCLRASCGVGVLLMEAEERSVGSAVLGTFRSWA